MPMNPIGIFAAVIAAAAASLSVIAPAVAQEWPTRPMTMVVAYAAGGPVDTLARIFAGRLSEILGQQVVIENIGGAGGMVGASRVAKAAPDGYTFLFGGLANLAQNQTLYKAPLYNAATDFTPVGLVTDSPRVLITRKDFPANTLAEFMAYVKANQAKLQYGSAGGGSGLHVCAILLDGFMGTKITHVPYRGAAPAMQDLIGGRLDYMCEQISTAFPQIEAGTVKAIAILGLDRVPVLPNLPTAQKPAGLLCQDFKEPVMNKTQLASALAILLGLTAAAPAQDYPNRPITLIVPFAAGGGLDVSVRIQAQRMSELLGQTIVTENIGAAAGTVGSLRVAKAAPDGYTFLIGNSGTHAYSQWLYKKQPYNAATHFDPVGMMTESPRALIARKNLPPRNLQEFIAYLKGNEKTAQFGSAGVGAGTHIPCVLLNMAIGVDITHIPYRGEAPVVQDLIGGRIDYMCATIQTGAGPINQGTVKGI